MRPVHPGEILREEYLKPLNMKAYHFADALHIPTRLMMGILAGRQAVSADTALRLALVLETTPEFWLNLQSKFDLQTAKDTLGKSLQKLKPLDKKVDSVPTSNVATPMNTPITAGMTVTIAKGCKARDVVKGHTAKVMEVREMGAEYSHMVKLILEYRGRTLVFWARHKNRLSDDCIRMHDGNPFHNIEVKRCLGVPSNNGGL